MNKESKTSAFADMFGALLLKLNFTHRPHELIKHRAGLHYALTYISTAVEKYDEMKVIPLNESQLGNHLKLLASTAANLTYASATLTETFWQFINYAQKSPTRESISDEIKDAVTLMFSLGNISANASDATKLLFGAELQGNKLDVHQTYVKDQFEASYKKYAYVPPVAGDMYLSQDEKVLYHIQDTYFSLVYGKVMVLFSHYGDVEHIMRSELDGSETDVFVVRYLTRNELHHKEASVFQASATLWKPGNEVIVRKNCEGDSDGT